MYNQADASNNSYNNNNNNNNNNNSSGNNDKSRNSKALLWIILGILIGAVICCGGAYYYINNVEGKECESEKVDNNKDKEVNGEAEVTDEMFNSLLLYKINDQISINPNIIADMKAGKPSDWTDFEKVFFALNSIVNDNISFYSCPDDNYDVCIPKYVLEKRVAQIFGDSITVKNADFTEFKKYPFDYVTNDIARYDDSSEYYVIDNLLAGHGGGEYKYYKSVVYKITNDNDKYKVYYALLYVVPGENNCFDICGPGVDTYKYYTDSSMKTLVYEDTGDNKKIDFTSSEYLSKLNKIIITYVIDKDMNYFTIANLETE